MANDNVKTVLLPADTLAAIYDRESKTLYLYAKGKFSKQTLIYFKRDDRFVGGLKFFFEGNEVSEQSNTEDEQQFAEKFDISLDDDHFHNTSLIVTVSGGHGIAPVDKTVEILKVPIIF
jgi:hypothetical protein